MKAIEKRPITPEIQKIARRAIDLYANERAEEAFELLQKGVDEHSHVRLFRLLARLRVFFGDEAGATEILKQVLPICWKPGFWELAQVGSRQGYAVKSEQHKLLYFPVRKCACTSMYNFMASIDGQKRQGEEIHDEQDHELVTFDTLRQDYVSYKTALVVRDPIARVRSFYKGNIEKREHLVRDTNGKESFYGLKTRPCYEEFLANFDAYRRTFITVRNHTDALVAFAGENINNFDVVVNVAGVSELQNKLAASMGIDIEPLHEMKSDGETFELTEAENALRSLYEEDYQLFGEYF
ncbi:sulfotransferase family 2 domain-containing protein [Kordiimonas sp. SCSIO 12603]|uniref:sulfotransferase family 2 domain-containing protein n=1 Tax=Kordiimonas sp. SCSIO 12603 TaxID=2829596 RepID=UPI002105FB2A|nr:sulfotransferase family 2 domain-containing protein [Kordiimonas sp. SCSIO 12603]UTW58388.1 sulfotransferase family 2 domain-containing protein [Kordiimonas sp. SCSIO 12603]